MCAAKIIVSNGDLYELYSHLDSVCHHIIFYVRDEYQNSFDSSDVLLRKTKRANYCMDDVGR